MERDAFETALSVALDILPRDAHILELSYDSKCRDIVRVAWCLASDKGKRTRPTPLVVSLSDEAPARRVLPRVPHLN